MLTVSSACVQPLVATAGYCTDAGPDCASVIGSEIAESINPNARINVHTQSVGDFADALMITAGVGYQFAGF